MGEEQCLIVGVSGGGTVPHRWCQWGRNSASSLLSVGEEQCLIVVVSGGGTVPHRWCQWGIGRLCAFPVLAPNHR
ncbi:unnamed protein product [Staurois parvus]|uniref:Uncharacterized protein n=1 Tax=Staurois parvus TaxID=386267 RepID=A0ABN9AL28_9NEOB|nr:unnamed protein product [Staurois parvus]